MGRLYGEGTTAIVCSHMRQSSKADSVTAGPLLAAEGFMVLAYDNRGDGESEPGLPVDRVLDLLPAVDLVRAATLSNGWSPTPASGMRKPGP